MSWMNNRPGSHPTFSRPATYDPDLAQRTQALELKEEIYRSRHTAAMKESLGLSDNEMDENEENEISSSNDNDDDDLEKNNKDNLFFQNQVEQLQSELASANLREQQAINSVSKLQLMSKSQIAILKTNFNKTLHERDDLLDDMIKAFQKYQEMMKEKEIVIPSSVLDIENFQIKIGKLTSSRTENLASEPQTTMEETVIRDSKMEIKSIDESVSFTLSEEHFGHSTTPSPKTIAPSSSTSKSPTLDEKKSNDIREPHSTLEFNAKKEKAYKRKIANLENEKQTLMSLLRDAQLSLSQNKKLGIAKSSKMEATDHHHQDDSHEVSMNSLKNIEKRKKETEKEEVDYKIALEKAEKEIVKLQKRLLKNASSLPPSIPPSIPPSLPPSIPPSIPMNVEDKSNLLERNNSAKVTDKTDAQWNHLNEELKVLGKQIIVQKEEITQLKLENTQLSDKNTVQKEKETRQFQELQDQLLVAESCKKNLRVAVCGALSEVKRQLSNQRNKVEGLRAQIAVHNQEFSMLLFQEIQEKLVRDMQKQQHLAMKVMSESFKKEAAERKRLFNLVQELRGNIRVFCRIRPISTSEIKRNCNVIATFPMEDEISLLGERGRTKNFEFDKVFSPESSQEQVFQEVQPLITSILDGYNVCIFAYGQTGSGKTHTMSGPPNDPGINTRALQDLFLQREKRSNLFTDEINVSILEIYNETIRDLLAQDVGAKTLSIRQGPTGNYIPDLTIVPVDTLKDVEHLIHLGNTNRSTNATDMNEHSSRSHSILSIYIKSWNRSTNVMANGKIHLVDLAGSERLSKSGATGVRLTEAKNINKSLSCLGDVIAARVAKTPHVPYRNSQLTYLLQDSLGGDSKTLMVACASPVDYNVEESLTTLTFAQRVRNVEMGKATKSVAIKKEKVGNKEGGN